MKKISTLFLLMLVALAGCTKESEDISSVEGFGSPVTVRFSVTDAALRAGVSDKKLPPMPIENMEVWVFDENGIFAQCEKAEELTSNTADPAKTVYTFKVSLLSTSRQCHIHFVANYSLKDNFDNYRGRSENYVFTSLRLGKEHLANGKFPMWGMVESDIQSTTKFTNISMVPSVCFLSLNLSKEDWSELPNIGDLKDIEFAIYRGRKSGTIAPFRQKADGRLEFGVDPEHPTEVPGNIDDQLTDADFMPISKYMPVFPQSNDVENPDEVPYIILRAKYRTDPEPYYFKLDIVDISSEVVVGNYKFIYNRFQLVRNTAVRLHITDFANPLMAGSKDLNSALISTPINNVALSPQFLVSPFINGVNDRLRVERVFWYLPENVGDYDIDNKIYNLKFFAYYFLNKNDDKPTNVVDKDASGRQIMKNDEIAFCKLDENNDFIQEIFHRHTTDKNTTYETYSNIYVRVNKNASKKEGKIAVFKKGDPSLVRIVTIKMIPNMDLKFTDNKLDYTQYDKGYDYDRPWNKDKPTLDNYPVVPIGSKFTFKIVLHKNFDKRLLPISFNFYSDRLMPDPASEDSFFTHVTGDGRKGSHLYYSHEIINLNNWERNADGSYSKLFTFITTKQIRQECLSPLDKRYGLKENVKPEQILVQTYPYSIFTGYQTLGSKTLDEDRYFVISLPRNNAESAVNSLKSWYSDYTIPTN